MVSRRTGLLLAGAVVGSTLSTPSGAQGEATSAPPGSPASPDADADAPPPATSPSAATTAAPPPPPPPPPPPSAAPPASAGAGQPPPPPPAGPPPAYGYAPPAYGPPAQGGAPSQPGAPPPAPPEPRGAYEHDGFYLRLALGATRLSTSFDSGDADPDRQGSVAGAAGAFDLALGGTITSGLVIGGGFFYNGGQDMTGGTLRRDDDDILDGDVAEYLELTFGIFGPFVDWYFDSKGGFHALAGLGFAGLDIGPGRVGDVTFMRAHSAGGVGAMLGVGYEFWIGRQWSMGALTRVIAGRLTGRDDEERTDWGHTAFAAPSLLFSVTYQ